MPLLDQDLDNSHNRAVIFAHYDKHDKVDPYVYFYLSELRKLCRTLLVISTAKLLKNDLDKLESMGCELIQRDNRGYDFMSYKTGLQHIIYKDYDEVVICNDSVYGPFFDLDKIFQMMESVPCDFWGMTSNTDISYHIQSYFVVFKKKVLNSVAFHDFWETLETLDSKREIIRRYEVGLTQSLLKSGLKSATSADFKPTLAEQLIYLSTRFSMGKVKDKIYALFQGENVIPKINNTHSFWKELILHGKMPFIKVEPLRDNPMEVDIDDYENVISSVSDYDTGLIKRHLSRMTEK